MFRFFQLFFFFSIRVLSQTITGVVIDENNKPLSNATIYFEGTTFMTLSDIDGNFSFTLNKKINSPLVVTFIGYNTYFENNPFENKKIRIQLTPKINQLNEVKIQNQLFSRQDKLKLFREQFLGKTKSSKYCIIENEDDIRFHYDANKNSLTAFCDKPLIITNNYLQYKLDFNLIEFEVKFNKRSIKSADVYKSLFLGTSMFKDISSSIEIKKIRDKIFYGSSKHFFKAIVDNDFNKNGFRLFKNSFQVPLAQYFLVVKENDLHKIQVIDKKGFFTIQGNLKFNSKFDLLYKRNDQSNVIFHTDTFYVDDYGNNSENDKIEFGGKLSENRVGNMLPMDYLPN